MKDLSLHLLDLLQNSTVVDSTHISLDIVDSKEENRFWFRIEDNGRGMSKEFLEKVTDPYSTTRTTRKVGLGLPLIKMNSEQCGGGFRIESEVGKGTILEFWFEHDHLDRPPMGDLSGVFVMTIAHNETIDFIMTYKTDDGEYVFKTEEVKEVLDGMPLNNNDIMRFLREMIEENLGEIKANQ